MAWGKKPRVSSSIAGCLRKKKLRTVEFADKIVEFMKADGIATARHYRCPICQCWHVTKKERHGS